MVSSARLSNLHSPPLPPVVSLELRRLLLLLPQLAFSRPPLRHLYPLLVDCSALLPQVLVVVEDCLGLLAPHQLRTLGVFLEGLQRRALLLGDCWEGQLRLQLQEEEAFSGHRHSQSRIRCCECSICEFLE